MSEPITAGPIEDQVNKALSSKDPRPPLMAHLGDLHAAIGDLTGVVDVLLARVETVAQPDDGIVPGTLAEVYQTAPSPASAEVLSATERVRALASRVTVFTPRLDV